jgi:hypothetical protein
MPLASLLSCLAERAGRSCTRLLGVRRTICCQPLRRTIGVGPIGHHSRCRGSNPGAPTGQSVSNAYGIGSRRFLAAAVRHPEAVVRACMDAGLVKGEGFAVDASVMEANASRYRVKAPAEIAC